MFVFKSQDDVQTSLDARKEVVNDEVRRIKEHIDGLKGQMTDLKTHLYAKFGNNINLEADDE